MQFRKIVLQTLGLLAIVCCDVLAQWVPCNGPYGGWVNALLAVSEGEGGTIVIAGLKSHIFRSTDNGAQWTAVSGPDLTGSVQSIIAGPDGFGGTNLYAASGSGICRSTNKGLSWTNSSTGLTDASVMCIIASGRNLFAGTYGGTIFRSSDYAASWISASDGFPQGSEVRSLAVVSHTTDPPFLFAATPVGLYRSTDDGGSWTLMGSAPRWFWYRSLAVIGTDLFANAQGTVYRSTDYGVSWSLANSGLENSYGMYLIAAGSSLFENASPGGLMRSTNKGDSWEKADSSLVRLMECLVAVDSLLLMGTPGCGVYCSTNNGTSWTLRSTGLLPVGVNGLATPLGSETLFAGSCSGMFRSTDNGLNWQTGDLGLPSVEVSSLAACEGDLFVNLNDEVGSFYCSSDHGKNWTLLATNFPVHSLACVRDSADRSFLFANVGGHSIYRSSDHGMTWTDLGPSFIDPGYKLVTVFGGDVYMLGSLGGYRSPMTGGGWTRLDAPQWINACTVLDTNLFVATEGGGVYRLSAGGTTWVSTNNGLSTDFVEALVTAPSATGGNNIYAGTEGSGVFMSSNRGESWTQVSSGISEFVVTKLCVTGGYLLADCSDAGRLEYAGLWRRPLSEMVAGVEASHNEVPTEYCLEQNYPNPFSAGGGSASGGNPTTTIRYSIGGVVALSGAHLSGVEGRISTSVTLAVYDVLGREVATLVNEVKAPGSYEVTFDGSGLASGVYVYRLTAGAYTESRKMVLVR